MLSILAINELYTEDTMKKSFILGVFSLAVFPVLIGCGQSNEEQATEKIAEEMLEKTAGEKQM